MGKPVLATSLAAKLERCYKGVGFKLFWAQVEREKRRAELLVMTVPRHDIQEGDKGMHVVPGLTEREYNYRKGRLDALMELERMKDELLAGLTEGNIPWQKLRPPGGEDDG